MKILILGAGVVGTAYAWQLSKAGQDVTLFVRKSRLAELEKNGIRIRYRDERNKQTSPLETVYHPTLNDELNPEAGYELIMVCVRAQQLDDTLPLLAKNIGKANVLFFGNNWWGDERIQKQLPAGQYLFGFSRLVGGWRNNDQIECIFFDTPGLVTMLGEKDGRTTPRLETIVKIFKEANLKPVISHDILGWLAIHYVEFLGVIGGILKAGSTKAFANDPDTIKDAILATREELKTCKARGIDLARAAPLNIRLVNSLPIFMLLPLVKSQYQTPSIQQFFEENIAHGREELITQYYDVRAEGQRLKVSTPSFESFEPYFSRYRNSSVKN